VPENTTKYLASCIYQYFYITSSSILCLPKYVILHSPENLKFMQPPRDRQLELGHSITVQCLADGDTSDDRPINIKWLKEGSSSLGPSAVDENGKLTFDPVTWTDNGTYTCIANNHQGVINKTVTFTVVGKTKLMLLSQ
jgi:hypothetical protein